MVKSTLIVWENLGLSLMYANCVVVLLLILSSQGAEKP